ncbi:uncharacterized protein LOC115424643 [Sphaeramia orbicularis]|uniref:uncharacterized protein LOC115424643 n=1 Tax=Sphaeramia orbicularis TaxID=375764 RepID=UPI0011810F0B|nr:uncharacterized protein LOC115424643 [Sphaeramia orbicularis]
MPQQHTHHSLIHVLLLWTTILSIIQIVSIVVFFKVERCSQCQNCSAVAREHKMPFHENNNTSSPPEFLLAKGKMANFESKGVHPNKTIEWKEDDSSSGLISSGYVLNILKDGYYFLSLRVTLECNGKKSTGQELDQISVKNLDKDILQGWFDAQTCSTGVLSKVERLAARSTLMVTITSNKSTNDSGSLTHLSVIYMDNP